MDSSTLITRITSVVGHRKMCFEEMHSRLCLIASKESIREALQQGLNAGVFDIDENYFITTVVCHD